MSKDIIYIDTEDDITSIIGKIKDGKEKVVALVPPKRTGVLQSAVNLRLLARTAKTGGKQLVIITNNQALTALSASAKILVAKNLQSQPEIPEIAALEVDNGEDVIEGTNLPVGELVKTVDHSTDEITEQIATIDIDNEGPKSVGLAEKSEAIKNSINAAKSKIKVPDFAVFRKRLFLIVGGGLLFVVFLVWAIWFAPAAKVIISAKTDPAPVSATLKLGGTEATNVNSNVIQSITKQVKKDLSVEFTPTGKKDVGNKASGSISIQNCDSSDQIVIPEGTIFTADTGERFLSSAQVIVGGLSGSASACRSTGLGAGTAKANVIAEGAGATYNIGVTSYSISGVSGDVYANGTAMTGGTTRMATVVTAADIQKASQELVDIETDDVKQELTDQFNNGESIISDSFTIERAAAVSKPAAGEEATGKATLTSKTTFLLSAIAKSELQAFLKEAINKQIDDSQRIYSDGIDKVSLSGFTKNEQGSFVNVASTGEVGPNINTTSIKNMVKGKQYGDAQSELENISGVSSADVKFSYFWVRTIPNDDKKIDVEFVIDNA